MKYAWIGAHCDSFDVTVMCRVLRVSTSGYYAWLQCEPSERQQRCETIAQAAEVAHRQSYGIYGYRKVYEISKIKRSRAAAKPSAR